MKLSPHLTPYLRRDLAMLSLALSLLAVVVSIAVIFRRPIGDRVDMMTATARTPLVMVGGTITPIANADYLALPGGVQIGNLNQTAITPTAFATGTPTYDNYTPGGVWPAASLLLLKAGDNEGTRLAGLLATGVAANDRKTICNITASGVDDSVIVLQYEQTSSTAANRFWTPDQTDTTIGKYGCVDVIYDGADSRWLVVAPATRMTRAAFQSLAIPCDALAPVLASGTTNDWAPTITNVQNTTAASGAGYAGCSLVWYASTYIKVQTDNAGSSLSGMAYTSNGNADPAGLNPVKMLINIGATGALTLLHKNGGSAGTNQFDLPGAESLVLAVGEGALLVHDTTGYWHVIGLQHIHAFANGITVLSGTAARAVDVAVALTGRTGVGGLNVGFNAADTGSFNTTAGAISNYGASFVVNATRSAGGNALTNFGLVLNAQGGQTNYALLTNLGQVYLGSGGGGAPFYSNMSYNDFATDHAIETKLKLGGGDFNGTTRQVIAFAGTAPTSASHGTLSADASNFMGRITTIGANTSTTLTFSAAFGTTAHCFVQAESTGAAVADTIYVTPSASAPVFNCLLANVAANCPDLSYMCWGH